MGALDIILQVFGLLFEFIKTTLGLLFGAIKEAIKMGGQIRKNSKGWK